MLLNLGTVTQNSKPNSSHFFRSMVSVVYFDQQTYGKYIPRYVHIFTLSSKGRRR